MNEVFLRAHVRQIVNEDQTFHVLGEQTSRRFFVPLHAAHVPKLDDFCSLLSRAGRKLMRKNLR